MSRIVIKHVSCCNEDWDFGFGNAFGMNYELGFLASLWPTTYFHIYAIFPNSYVHVVLTRETYLPRTRERERERERERFVDPGH